jgi:peroxiredoxin
MRHLQKLYEKYKDEEVVILGFNCADDKEIALEFMRENSATFPNIIDSSHKAGKVYHRDYRGMGVPLNYIIDREGKIIDSWYGYEKGHKRAKEALKKSGVNIEDQ